VSALALALVAAALAGDPCPIPVRFAAAPPSWRDGPADLAALQSERRWFGLTYRERGGQVVVVATAAGSPAAAVLAPGDLVVTAAGAPVASKSDLDAAFDSVDDAGSLALTVSRDGATRSVALSRGRADPLLFGLLDHTRAHAALAPVGLEPGTVVLVRGGRRVLLTLPGWATRCVSVADTDGAGLTPERLSSLLDALTGAYVADRHANP
jgi:hypothetical protein